MPGGDCVNGWGADEGIGRGRCIRPVPTPIHSVHLNGCQLLLMLPLTFSAQSCTHPPSMSAASLLLLQGADVCVSLLPCAVLRSACSTSPSCSTL